MGDEPSRWWLPLLVPLLAIAPGCSSSPDASAGAELFARESLGELRGCSTCHSVDDRPAVAGPSLVDIGRWAGERVEGVAADTYLRESILAPTAHFVEGWGEGMPSYAGVLTPEEVDALVDYLTSLR